MVKQITATEDNLAFFAALASPLRLQILEILAGEPLNIGEVARRLGISHVMAAAHLRKLTAAGLVRVEERPARRGKQKVFHLAWEDCWVTLARLETLPAQTLSLPIGQYVNYEVSPTCGLVGPEGVIGSFDDPRCFADPRHVEASLLWFHQGFVEYRIPNYLLRTQHLQELVISLELCSEAPGYNEDYPSEITFLVNGVPVGSWISPGDFGKERGRLTPAWWTGKTQYGLYKELRFTEKGTFLEGEILSPVKISDLAISGAPSFLFRIAVLPEARYVGGVTLFGRFFGNYPQDIEVRFLYREEK